MLVGLESARAVVSLSVCRLFGLVQYCFLLLSLEIMSRQKAMKGDDH